MSANRLKAWWSTEDSLDVGLLVVILGAALWTGVIGRLVMRRHNLFGTFDYDLGIHDQSIWLLSRGGSFSTIRGTPVFGHHATFAYYLLVPFYWLGAGPNFINVVQCAAIALCALPIYLLCKRRFDRRVWATLVALAWLLQPWLGWFAQETFHPEVMAMPFLLWAYYLVDPRFTHDAEVGWSREDLGAFGLFLLAVCWKEDVALAVAVLGVSLWFAGRRRVGLRLAIGGVLWFAVFGAWMVPMLAGGATVYGGLYGSLGTTSSKVFLNAFLKPRDFVSRLGTNRAGLYAWRLAAPFGLLAVFAPSLVLVMAPQFFANILTTANFTYSPRFHYQAIPMVALTLASIEGMVRVRESLWSVRRGVRSGVVVLFLVVSLLGQRGWGILPGSQQYRAGAWPLIASDTSGWRAAVERIGSSDGAAVDYRLVPHLTHRRTVYTFPNPWLNSNYGINPDDRGDPYRVEWIAVEEWTLNDAASALLEELVQSGEFGDRQEVGNIVTYRRLRPA